MNKKDLLNERAKKLVAKAREFGMVYNGNKAFKMYPPSTEGYFVKSNNNNNVNTLK